MSILNHVATSERVQREVGEGGRKCRGGDEATYGAIVIEFHVGSICLGGISLLSMSLHVGSSAMAMLCLLFQDSEFRLITT